jgi:hypothetical protein
VTCGEMGLAHEFLRGSSNEWSLVRRSPEERVFGVQVCGNKPQVSRVLSKHRFFLLALMTREWGGVGRSSCCGSDREGM